ncbi:hypothetical protein LTR37_006438 [Vermiconidia calcicola]|uniref:Uncharacterized protein n=1 Tax=Vermiconidia calcicola TaxID=1690605 RepID=A0ACC3NH88_9PEZI|nr:hypothetical protein LTR37_006438 [Vermiconidia calcicola]
MTETKTEEAPVHLTCFSTHTANHCSEPDHHSSAHCCTSTRQLDPFEHDFGNNEIDQFESFRATQRGAKVLGPDAVNPAPVEAGSQKTGSYEVNEIGPEGETKFTIDNFRAIRGLCGRLDVELATRIGSLAGRTRTTQDQAGAVHGTVPDRRPAPRIADQPPRLESLSNLLAKPDADPKWRFTSSPTQSPDW